MCHLRAGLKLFLKNAGGEKIKTNGQEMSVGLLVVRFQYGLYVVVYLSKFVSLFSVFTRSMSAVSCAFMLAANVKPPEYTTLRKYFREAIVPGYF